MEEQTAPPHNENNHTNTTTPPKEASKAEYVNCFVILPFSGIGNDRDSEYWENFFNTFIKNQIEKNSFHVRSNSYVDTNDSETQKEIKFKVSKHERSSGNTLNEIIPKLIGSELVIAILTDLKPNVIYELGIRHATRHGTILAVKKSVLKEFKSKLTNLVGYTLIEYEDFDPENFLAQFKKIISRGFPTKLWEDSDVYKYQKNNIRQDAEQKPIYHKLTAEYSNLVIDKIALDILWLDNYSESVAPIITYLLKKGAKITFSVHTYHFITYLQAQKFDAIISDMREGNDESEGITNYLNVKKGTYHKNTNVPYIIFAGESSMFKYGKKAIASGLDEKNLISKPEMLVERLIELYEDKTQFKKPEENKNYPQ